MMSQGCRTYSMMILISDHQRQNFYCVAAQKKTIMSHSAFRVPRPPPNDDQFYTVEDFNIGRELTLYGRVFKLTACDEFTRNFLTKLGVRVPPPDGTPEDPYSDHRKAVS